LLAGLSSSASADSTAFVEIGGMAIGASPHAAEWLMPSTQGRPACVRESHYQAKDADQGLSVAGVPLARPGLVYKFLDGRLYAVEGRLPAGGQAFSRLFNALTSAYGRPAVYENWAGSPTDSFSYQRRLRMAGWFDAEAQRSVWLTGHDDGGSLVLTRTAPASDLGSACGDAG
jgi:hypothetical protein